ncbi:hypothetical protein BBP40_008174 [Aspergillus hancockii]|nr:hypothetical protein BBP40_008174 [Aspergillus hancockii]
MFLYFPRRVKSDLALWICCRWSEYEVVGIRVRLLPANATSIFMKAAMAPSASCLSHCSSRKEIPFSSMLPKNQCGACVRGRLVCDGATPACTKCIKRSTICPGYSKQRQLRWIETGRTSIRKRATRFGETATPDARSINVITPPIAPSPEIAEAIMALEYYNGHVAPDLVAYDTPQNPFKISFADFPLIPQHLLHLLSCIVLTHRLVRQGWKLGQPLNDHQVAVYRHRGNALSSLNREIATVPQQNELKVLSYILAFMLAELQHGSTENCLKHLDAAKRILGEHGGVRAVFGLDRRFDAQLAYLMIVDVMRVTTSPVVNTGIVNQHEYLSLIDDNLTLVTCFACPAELFKLVIVINVLRLETQTSGVSELHTEAAMDILQRILDFDLVAWAEDSIPRGEDVPSDRDMWVKLGQAYQEAVALYCIGSLTHIFQCGTPYWLYLSSCRKTIRLSLRCRIVELFSPRYTQLVKLVLWPLVVAGIEVTADYTDFQANVREYLAQVATNAGTGSPYKAIAFLDRFWGQATPSSDLYGWLMFDRDMVFVV